MLNKPFIMILILVFFLTCVFSNSHPQELYLGQEPPGANVKLFAPGIISNCDLHSSVYFSKDNELYFSKHLQSWSIMAIRFINGKWTKPEIVMNGLTPFISTNTPLYFSSEEDWDIYVSERRGSRWQTPKNLGPVINFSRRQDVPSVTKDSTLYFCAVYGEDKGIYRCERINGQYSNIEKLGFGINSDYNDFGPFVDPDEMYIIFTSFRPGSYGLGDLYISFRKSGGAWSEPVHMGSKINTIYKERFPSLSPDRKYLFFNSNRPSELNEKPIPDGPGNVFWVDAGIIDQLKSKPGE